MNLKQLEVFLAVAESGNFSRGAEATYITQSTVSQHISALENEFDLRLLDRTGRGALLTEGGKVLYQHARQVIAGVQAIDQAIKRFKGIEDTDLRVGGSNIPANYMIPELFTAMIARFPKLRLILFQGDSRDILDRLAREEIELGIIGSTFDDESFSFAPLGRDEISLVVNRAHPWSDRESVELEELAQEPMIRREPGSGTDKTVTEALLKGGMSPDKLRVVACLGSNEAVKNAVIGGLGVSFVSELSVRKEVERQELAIVKVKGLKISRHFYLASRAGRQLSPAAKAFAVVLKEHHK